MPNLFFNFSGDFIFFKRNVAQPLLPLRHDVISLTAFACLGESSCSSVGGVLMTRFMGVNPFGIAGGPIFSITSPICREPFPASRPVTTLPPPFLILQFLERFMSLSNQ
jgi:hypothetical protein